MPSERFQFQCPTCQRTAESWHIIETHPDGHAVEQTIRCLCYGELAQCRIHATDDGQLAMTFAKLEMP